MDLAERVHVSAHAECGFELICGLACLLAGGLHGVLQARVNDVLLLGAFDDLASQLLRQEPRDGGGDEVVHHLHHELLGTLLPFLGQAAESHMLKVLEPLDVGHGHAAGVEEEVRDDVGVLAEEDVLRGGRHGPVGALADHAAVQPRSVAPVNGLLHGRRDEHVAGPLEDLEGVLRVQHLGRGALPAEPLEGAMLEPVGAHLLRVEPRVAARGVER
mmetsp:Transcript_8040/g.27319  ORF Transcript_8040/g.27319 Transcript_8040/m.27319 type:complete len:216 (-) Transcript_8040:808-1455(-)